MRWIAIAVCCVLLVLGAAWFLHRHDTEAVYATRADAEKHGEFTRGWLPEFLPASSRNIRMAYDLSPSESWCAFEFDLEDSEHLRTALEKKTSNPARVSDVRDPDMEWWPEILKGSLDETRLRASGLATYSYTEQLSPVLRSTTVFFVDWKSGRAYFYDR